MLSTRVVRGGRGVGSPHEARGIADPDVVQYWEMSKTRKRTCCVCGTVYLSAGYAWRCERWHWRD